MSLYASYVKERTNKQIIETDYGFVTYYYLDNEIKGLMIEDLYIHPEHRLSGKGKQLVDSLVAEARLLGHTKCYSSICPYAKQATESIKANIAWGLKLHSINNNLIFLCKDI